MERWILYAVLAAAFAGVTSVIAKHGLAGISGETGLAVRTVFVAVFVFAYTLFAVPTAELKSLTRHNVLWLALSGLTAAVSWGFYHKALELGEVSTVAFIDKGSILVAVLLAWLLLGERLTWQVLLGGGLIIIGLVFISRR